MEIVRAVIVALLVPLQMWSCDRNEHPPYIEDQEFDVYESGYFLTRNPTVKASDADGDQNLSYMIIDGNEEGIFSLNHSNGYLSLSRPELYIHGRVLRDNEFRRLYPEF